MPKQSAPAPPTDGASLYLKVADAARLVGCSRTAMYDLLVGYGGEVAWMTLTDGGDIWVSRASLTDFLARREAEATAARAS